MKITYICKGCAKNIKRDAFNRIVRNSTNETRNALNYPLSFIPVSLNIEITPLENKYFYETNEKIENAFSVEYVYKYIAKNAYNAEKEGSTIGTMFLVNGFIKENFMDMVKLDSLYLIDSNYNYKKLNRNLFLTTYKKDGYIEITPFIEGKTLDLIIKSSYTCVDKGANLVFEFNDNSKVELSSNNDFNCDGTMIFWNIPNNQLKKIGNSDISRIYTYNKNIMSFWLPKNESDYFKQLISLIN